MRGIAVNELRRYLLRAAGGGVVVALSGGAGLSGIGPAQAAEAASAAGISAQPGMPLPDEAVADTLERLFGARPLEDAGERIRFDAPLIAENGFVVPVRIETSLPMTADDYVRSIYIISDRNRRPLNAQFAFTPASGSASVGTNIRLASSSDVRVIAETSTGRLYQARREVKVTVGGCGG